MATNGDLARLLLGAARDDELMASSLLPVKGVTDAGIGLHAQQAVEKAIKAVLAVKETKFPFTHDLKRLRDFATGSGIELPPTLDGIEELTPFARDERYGSETSLGLDREQALKWAAEAIAWARTVVEEP
ncbi:MAG TPA: HEPN domain-containing protein [Solirubrobacteraceae bacterium]|nr:HEPN domain-containing protein [Solirubrobacteraceae bacterium]